MTEFNIDVFIQELCDFASIELNRMLTCKDISSKLKEYNPDLSVHFAIVSSGRFYNQEYERLRKKDELKKKDVSHILINMIENMEGLSGETPARTVVSYVEDDNHKVSITSLSIYIGTDNLFEAIVRNLDRVNDVSDYYKLMIRHEVGHARDFIGFMGMDFEEYLAMTDEREKDRITTLTKIKNADVNSVEECFAMNMLYHTEILEEKIANQYANFTDEEFQLFVSGYHLYI